MQPPSSQPLPSPSPFHSQPPSDGRDSSLSHTIVRFTPHKLFPPRLKLRSQSLNPRTWNFKKKQQFLSTPFRPSFRPSPTSTPTAPPSKLPGPGSYSPSLPANPPLGLIHKIPSHNLLPNTTIHPGPGFYNISTVWKGREPKKPSFSSIKLLELFDLMGESTPGVGEYEVKIGDKPTESKYRAASMGVMGKGEKEARGGMGRGEKTPGVGEYEVSRVERVKKSPYKFLHRYME